MAMKIISVTDIEGFKLGNAQNKEKGTGCTVIVCEEGAVGGVDVRGGGPATRETDLLRSENTVNAVNAVVLSGGSAFGLEAASGVMRELADRKIGFDCGDDIVVPIVCGASLYDLPVGDPKAFPDVYMGAQAVRNAYDGAFARGNNGAGTGATVGKLKGYDRAMKTGLGTFACSDGVVEVGAIAAVNAVGDIYNGAGNIVAGLRSEDGSSIYGTIKTLKGMVHDKVKLVDDSTLFINRSEIEEALAAAARQYEDEEAVEPEAEAEDEVPEERAAEEILEEPAVEVVEEVVDEQVDETVENVAEEPAGEIAEEAIEESVDESFDELIDEPAEESVQDEIIEETADEQKEELIDEPEETVAEPEAEFVQEEVPEQTEELPAEEKADAFVEEEPVVLSREDMGYDIVFNTTISCLITNAALTKSQANKLASILHDAYARAIKPVHGTMDGDTVFVLATGMQQVNFDAFAALATDIMQYAIIDGAMSAESAYGLPAARDMQRSGE